MKQKTDSTPIVSKDWIEDCMICYGEVLNGAKGHWCPDWDYLPIDENSFEIKYCTCFKEPLKSS